MDVAKPGLTTLNYVLRRHFILVADYQVWSIVAENKCEKSEKTTEYIYLRADFVLFPRPKCC